jgi:hypothetical protein
MRDSVFDLGRDGGKVRLEMRAEREKEDRGWRIEERGRRLRLRGEEEEEERR